MDSRATVIRFLEKKIDSLQQQVEWLNMKLRTYKQDLEILKSGQQKELFEEETRQSGKFVGLSSHPQEAVRTFFLENKGKKFTAAEVREELLRGGFMPNQKTFVSVIHSCLGRLTERGTLKEGKPKNRLDTDATRGPKIVKAYYMPIAENAEDEKETGTQTEGDDSDNMTG